MMVKTIAMSAAAKAFGAGIVVGAAAYYEAQSLDTQTGVVDVASFFHFQI